MYSIGDLRLQVNRLKKNRALITNCFLSSRELEESAAEMTSVFEYNEKSAALFCQEETVNRLYFYLDGIDAVSDLKKLLRKAPRLPFVTDCVGKEQTVAELEAALCGVGFSFYAKYTRWSSSGVIFPPKTLLNNSMFQRSTTADAPGILSLINETFDPLTGHLPNREKLMDLIKSGTVFHVFMDTQYAAVVCLEKKGKNSIYIYLDIVAQPYRGRGIGKLLLQYALWQYRECPCVTSWTPDDPSLVNNRMHEALGMVRDGLKDSILIYRQEEA